MRDFRPGDQAMVRALVLAGLAERWSQLDPQHNADLDDIATRYSHGRTLVEEEADGRIVATGTVMPREDGTAEIVRMSVAADRRRGGLGGQIVHALVETAWRWGCGRVVLETTSTWVDAIAFYLRCGFAITHETDGEFGRDTWFAMDLPQRMHHDELFVDEALVRRLLVAQMPTFAELPLTRVEPWGTDNAVFRLGDELTVRLPRMAWAQRQATLEARWLPHLAPTLPVAVPEPVAVGEPGERYPFRWAVCRWVPGEMAGPATVAPEAFTADLAAALRALHEASTEGAPSARNRARPLQAYDADARQAINAAAHLIDVPSALAVWEDALAAPPYAGPLVWVHGDLEGNCIVREGRLVGLVDWGSMCVGDPAVDVQVVWSPLFDDATRQAFVAQLGVDDATLRRSRGAAVQQACAALPYYLDTYPLIVERCRHKLAALGVGLR